MPNFASLADTLRQYALLKSEQRAPGLARACDRAVRALRAAIRDLERLPADPRLAAREPDRLAEIRRQRPTGHRDRLWTAFDPYRYRDQVAGAMLARFAGCTLGALVEGWPVLNMRTFARYTGGAFPPVDYWPVTPENPETPRYNVSRLADYTRSGMDGVPADDDVTYTILGLLILEESGPKFTTADVGRAWVRHLPIACTAEDVALKNLKRGIPAARAAVPGNPYLEWIGADIRSDPWAYAAPGWPERAAEMAHRDAWLSHRRNGIYGSMFFAAAQAAAFAVDDPVEALRIGLGQIPARCRLADDLRWALAAGRNIRNHEDARLAVDKRFKGMSPVHTNNNACLTVFGLMIGGTDVTKVLSQTVAMGLDNDCTAASAGSIAGAIVGARGIPRHWTRRFHDKAITYLDGRRDFSLSGLVRRFARQAAKVWATADR